MAPAALLVRHVDDGSGHGCVSWQARRDLRELILAPASRQTRIGKVVGDLLQAKDIEIGDGQGVLDDAPRIDLAIDAAAPLGVPGDELHLIPARMNDCTNCRWKSRNGISSGALVSRVAAVMIDQSIP